MAGERTRRKRVIGLAAVAGMLASLLGLQAVSAVAIPYGAQLRERFVVNDDGTPADGDPDGSANVFLDLDPSTGDVCVDWAITGIGTPVAARVHRGVEGTNGPSVFDLPTPPAAGGDITCLTVAADALGDIVAEPTAYYLLLSTDEFPDGALRGQLHLTGLCQMYLWRQGEVDEGVTDLSSREGEAVHVSGTFADGADVDVTVVHEGTVVARDVTITRTDGFTYAELDLAFEAGDHGLWSVSAVDPAIGDCESTATIDVEQSFAAPGDGGGGAPLPDTALAPAPAPSLRATLLLLLAAVSLAVPASYRAVRMRR